MRRVLLVFGVLAAVPKMALSQSRDSITATKPGTVAPVAAAPACCTIVRIETTKSLVTARETATGFTFRFAVTTRRLLGALKIGQPVWADFAAKTVKLKGTDVTPCCAIVETPPVPDAHSLGSAQRLLDRAAHTQEVK